MQDYLSANKRAYDQLADQYRQRIDDYLISDVPLLKPFIEAIETRFTQPKVLELGPGSGLALSMFEEAGFDTTAIEIAEEIIKVAKETSPHSKFIHADFLSHDFGLVMYDGVFAKAFVHLFPKDDGIKVLDKIYLLTSEKGVLFLSTTLHSVSSEGYEEKADYDDSPKRFRRKWTEDELLDALSEKWKILDKNYNQERNKKWLALTLAKK